MGFAFEGNTGGQDDETGTIDGTKLPVELSDNRKLGVVTLGAMKQYSRIEKILKFLQSWYLCYFLPDAARKIQTPAPQLYLDRIGSNLNNVAQYMYRENKNAFMKTLHDIQKKLPGVEKIEPLKMPNGQIVLQYLENGLYHHYLADLAEEMRKNVGNGFSKQLFVTTHGPFFINFGKTGRYNMHFQFLVEDYSGAVLVDKVMQKLLEEAEFTFDIKLFKGIGGFKGSGTVKDIKTNKLLTELPQYLRAFAIIQLHNVRPQTVTFRNYL